ncbi:SDR family oxidoreductase [Limosilactobacillus fermentum]|nr:SDR family oxidoreductase [Limosilactobacillus fermentum]
MRPPIGQPGQIANLALFLASDEASSINGDIVKADGGWTVN